MPAAKATTAKVTLTKATAAKITPTTEETKAVKKTPKASAKTSTEVAFATSIDHVRTAFAALAPEEQRTLLAEWTQAITSANSLTQLVELVQKEYGANLTTEVWTEGAAHVPLVYCKITLPNGTEYTASGKNQKAAKQLAAEEALSDLKNA
ncbi:MAG: double-stranded RNA binding motif domain-containing protein [Candidatus Kapabacteria bacterium]|jgi:dsRNA-specific ribonuclease|nr:double-stranded RNA binding motif domain-containing protein [Candidatus Kapabacteria bacterium]